MQKPVTRKYFRRDICLNGGQNQCFVALNFLHSVVLYRFNLLLIDSFFSDKILIIHQCIEMYLYFVGTDSHFVTMSSASRTRRTR